MVLASALGYATASCPSNCNGHGVCGEYDLCHCYANWQGLSCGDRVCPYGKGMCVCIYIYTYLSFLFLLSYAGCNGAYIRVWLGPWAGQ